MSDFKRAPLIGCLFIATQANATDIVLYREGLQSDITTRIERVDGVADSHELHQFDALLKQHQASLSRGLMSACLLEPEDLKADNLEQRLKRARSAVQYEDFEPANEHLTKAEQLFRCSTSLVDPATGAQLYMLYGIVAYHQGDERTTRDRFERAFLFQEALEWDSGNPGASNASMRGLGWGFSLAHEPLPTQHRNLCPPPPI